MTLRHCRSQVVCLVCLFFVFPTAISARGLDANPQAKAPAPPPTIQEQDPLTADQLTLKKTLALSSLLPGEYEVTVKINDPVQGRQIAPAARFTVE